MKKTCNIMLTIGIVWIMILFHSFNSYAATSFTKEKPLGVMSTAVKKKIAVTWEPVKGASGYEVYEAIEVPDLAENTDGKEQVGTDTQTESGKKALTYKKIKETTGCRLILSGKKDGQVYHYYIRPYKKNKKGNIVYGKKSKQVSTTVAKKGTSTVKNFLQTAIAPIGSTMYVWGGGWNKADTAAGKEAKQIGLSPAWRKFAAGKTASYNYQNYRYRIHDGLDCSGYVGWTVYNVLNTKNNKKGYVWSASKQAEKFANMGFGIYRSAKKVKDYKAGDIMSSSGHVWIVIGECPDGSVVLVHSSPSGVQISGTTTPEGNTKSQAYSLAKKYMKKYYSAWNKKYPAKCKGISYLTDYGQMRWKTTGESVVLSDPDGYQDMSAEEILQDLFR